MERTVGCSPQPIIERCCLACWSVLRIISNPGPYLIGFVSIALASLIIFASDQAILSWTDDDSYYYFETARNWVNTGVTSFDLVTKTNGYQPLWFLVITPFFAFTDAEIVPLKAVLLFQVLILAGCSLLAHSLVMRLVGDRRAALLASMILFYPVFINQMVSGMEAGLGVLLILLFLFQYVRWAADGYPANRQRYLVAISLALVPLARIDMLFFAAFAIIGIAFQAGLTVSCWRSVIGRIGPVIYLPVTIFGLYAVSNILFYGGGFLPVSGAVKSDFSVIQITDFEIWSDVLRVSWDGLLPDFGLLFYLSPLVVGLAIFFLRKGPSNRFGRFALYAATFSYLAQIVAYHLFLRWRGTSEWWLVLSPVIVVLLVVWLQEQSRSFQQTTPKLIRVGVLGVTFLFAALAIVWSANFLIRSPQPNSHVMKKNISKQLEDLDGAIFAMGDGAGSMGYFLEQPVIHLEGFVADREYLEALENGRIDQFLSDNGVTHLIAFNESAQEILDDNYSTFDRIEPTQPSWRGARSTITVNREDELLREYWRQGNRDVVLVVWRLAR